jgi:large subunit ribosomal protein L4
MAAIEIKDKAGKKVGSHDLSAALTTISASHTTIHRAVVAEEANSRQGTQSAKTRSEVRGGGRKPYKQKKTGNARQGTIRAPHYAHGGMAMAVKPRDYSKKINKQEKRAAILSALAMHFEAGNVTVVDSIAFGTPKTKDAIAFLAAHGLSETRRVLVITTEVDDVTTKSFRNLKSVELRTAPASVKKGEEGPKTQAFSARDVLVAHKVVIVKDALTRIEEVWAK